MWLRPAGVIIVAMRPPHPYLLANAAAQADARFAALSELFDHITFGHFDRVGLGPGWRCWEVGAGGPTVPQRIARRVGPGGRVVATDIDTSRLREHDVVGIEVIVHDVARDDPPGREFDLVHARLVLTHVPERYDALRSMISALRPGGWLVIEDFDPALLPAACLEVTGPQQHRANKIRRGFLDLLGGRGVDLYYGRKLPRLFREHGLTQVGADAYFPVCSPSSRLLEAANTAQLIDAMVSSEHASREDIDGYLAALHAGELDITMPPLVSAWGASPC